MPGNNPRDTIRKLELQAGPRPSNTKGPRPSNTKGPRAGKPQPLAQSRITNILVANNHTDIKGRQEPQTSTGLKNTTNKPKAGQPQAMAQGMVAEGKVNRQEGPEPGTSQGTKLEPSKTPAQVVSNPRAQAMGTEKS